MVSYIIHCVICSPLHIVSWDGSMLVLIDLVCQFLLMYSVSVNVCPTGFIQGVPTFRFSQEKPRSLLSELGRYTQAPKQRTSYRKKTEHINDSRALTLHPAQALCSELWKARSDHQCRASTLEREQGYYSLFHHPRLSFWIANSLERLTKLGMPLLWKCTHPERTFMPPGLGSGHIFLHVSIHNSGSHVACRH